MSAVLWHVPQGSFLGDQCQHLLTGTMNALLLMSPKLSEMERWRLPWWANLGFSRIMKQLLKPNINISMLHFLLNSGKCCSLHSFPLKYCRVPTLRLCRKKQEIQWSELSLESDHPALMFTHCVSWAGFLTCPGWSCIYDTGERNGACSVELRSFWQWTWLLRYSVSVGCSWTSSFHEFHPSFSFEEAITSLNSEE